MTWFRWLRRRPLVPVIQLTGTLDYSQFMFFMRCMRISRNLKNVKGLCLQISSEGGSGVKADTIAKLSRDFCDERGIKLYTFVDKYATSAAMLPLASSDLVYVHPESILGGCQATTSQFVSTADYGIKRWDAEGGDELFMKNYTLLPGDQVKEEKFEDLLNSVLKEDTKILVAEIKEKMGGKLNSAFIGRIESGDYFNGKEAVEAGLATGLGTIQKMILKDIPEAKFYYIPRIDTGLLNRRYFNRSIRSGLLLFLFAIVVYKVVSYIIKLGVAATTAKPKKQKTENESEKKATVSSGSAN